MAWQTLRTVVEEHTAAAAVDGFASSLPRFSEAYEALKWLLSRNPTPAGSVSKIVDGLEWRAYVQAGDDLANTPQIWVTYTYSLIEVNIRGLHAIAKAAPSAD